MGAGRASDTAPAETNSSFTTKSGKVHVCSNKVEVGVQVICVLLSIGALIMIAFQAQNENELSATTGNVLFVDYKGIGYTFAAGTFLCVCLVFNAGAALPILTPLMMGVGYFYFGGAIAHADQWRQAKDNGTTFDNYDQIMAGAVLSLMATAVACLFEVSLPGSGKGRASGCGGSEVAGILFLAIGVCGLMVMWIKNDVDEGGEDYYSMQKLSIEAVISMCFLADSLMHYDADITNGAIMIGTLTGCQMFLIGIEYESIPDRLDDIRIARQGALVTAVSIAILTVVSVLTSALGRNRHEQPRRAAVGRNQDDRKGGRD